METLTYTLYINAPISVVYETMLGLKDIRTYETWTAIFNPTSSYEGTWEKGSKMYFTGTDKSGKKAGMISTIIENQPNKLVVIEHYGLLDGEQEITHGPLVDSWTGCKERYSFTSQNAGTELRLSIDAQTQYTEYYNKTFPEALKALKQLIEA